MKNFTINNLAAGIAAGMAAFLLSAGPALAQSSPGNVTDAAGKPVRDASGNCVLSSAAVHPDCAPKKKEEPKPVAPATPVAPPPPAAPAAPATPAEPPKPAPAAVKQSITIQAEALFDFDKSVVKPTGKKSLDDAVASMAGIDLELVIAAGHTDSIGTEVYNQKLSERRANAVKAYLVSKGVPDSKITTLGKGETQPVATNKTKEGRAKNRRVDVEFKGVKQ
jgi:OOP family OmpA-OmpF porin